MNYPLAEILRLRLYRENSAAAAVQVCQRKLEAARQEVHRREKKHAEYHAWRLQEEPKVFEKIRGQKIGLADIDAYKDEIQALRAEEIALEEAIFKAKVFVSECAENVVAAQNAHSEAVHNRQKIEAHKDIWQKEDKKIKDQAEEREMEEFTSPSFLSQLSL